ncbi:LOB domain-containing protein 23-like [Papaver somniferum]|nr:LOB domain-containing protein 23-like [Papaver somniferum]
MLQRLPVSQRSEAADCMSLEATWRVQDPVYGCVGIISQLQQQILMVQSELAKTQGEIAFHNAQQQQQTQLAQEPIIGGTQWLFQFGQPSSSSTNINVNQEDMISNLDQQPFLDFLNR